MVIKGNVSGDKGNISDDTKLYGGPTSLFF